MEQVEVTIRSSRITEEKLWRVVLSFGAPLMVAMMFHALFNLVDLYIVAQIPNIASEAIVAVTIGGIITMIPMVIGQGLSTATIALVSRYYGSGKVDEAGRIASRSFFGFALLSVAAALVGVFGTRWICLRMGAEGLEIPLSIDYLGITMTGAFTMFFLLQTTAVLRAAGNSFWPMVLLVGANTLNLVGDIVLIFGWGPIPAMGVAGAAWATVIARAVGAGAGLILLALNPHMKIRLGRLKGVLPITARLLWIGIPNSLQFLVRTLGVMFLMGIVSRFGTAAKAAFGVGIRLDMLALFSCAGWGAAASTLVGQNLGAKKPWRAERAGWVSAAASLVLMAIIAVLYRSNAQRLIGFFDRSPEVIEYGTHYIRIVSLSYLFGALALTLAMSLNGAGSTKTPLCFDGIGFLPFQLGMAYYLVDRMGLSGVWYAILVTNAFLAATYAIWFKAGRWKKKKI